MVLWCLTNSTASAFTAARSAPDVLRMVTVGRLSLSALALLAAAVAAAAVTAALASGASAANAEPAATNTTAAAKNLVAFMVFLPVSGGRRGSARPMKLSLHIAVQAKKANN